MSYKELVDMDALTQSGQPVREVLARVRPEPRCKGQLQPFLDRFSRLLPEALAMVTGPPELPPCDVSDHFPPGARQPAWAAIARSGRVFVTDDGNARASAFIPGEDPEVAYRAHYGVLRHILTSLLPQGGEELRVSVYAYYNDYEACELRLNLKPHVVEAAAFGAPSGKMALDLVGLQHFFEQGPELEGGKIDRSRGLILVGGADGQQSLAGKAVSLSDLAVAYRAVFHAGDNAAFVSLDPHRDPTLVTVNFGGYLEDTRIGHVVLEADKRFKTITCGLDPNSFDDLRPVLRQAVPGFATVGERDLCVTSGPSEGWEGTRFWYYPDSVEIAADLDYSYAAIEQARFTADAERLREDFGTPEAFEGSKRTRLSPSIRHNIDHLNRQYGRYASAFPELRELSTVARLMGICVWLEKAKPAFIDLDGLLEVELPAYGTPRQKPQLVAASCLLADPSEQLTLEEVHRRAFVKYLTPMLDCPIGEVFPTEEDLARYLVLAEGGRREDYARSLDKARQMLRHGAREMLRTTVHSEQALKALAECGARSVDMPLPPELARLEAEIEKTKAEIDGLERVTRELSAVMSRSAAAHNRNVSKYNRLVNRHETLTREVNLMVEQYKSQQPVVPTAVEIGGGVGLEPNEFGLHRRGSSPALLSVKRAVDGLEGTEGVLNGQRWLRTRPRGGGSSLGRRRVARSWTRTARSSRSDGDLTSAASGSSVRYWRIDYRGEGGWRDQISTGQGVVRVRHYDAGEKTLQIADVEGDRVRSHIVGQREGRRKIVFRKSARRDLLTPTEPPRWWSADRKRER